IYILANLMYLAVMPLEAMAFAPSERVAVAASEFIFGETGTYIIAIMIMVSTFGCNNGLILAGARVYYTMAKDKLFFKKPKISTVIMFRAGDCGYNVFGLRFYVLPENMATCSIT